MVPMVWDVRTVGGMEMEEDGVERGCTGGILPQNQFVGLKCFKRRKK